MPKRTVTKPAAPQESQVALAMDVSARVQIRAITLLTTTAKRPPLAAKLPTNIELIIDVQHDFNEQKQEVGVRVCCGLLGREPDQKHNDPTLEIRAEYWLLYSLSNTEGLREENFRAFADLNGVYNVWPYWREYVQSTVARMGMPPLPIPVFRPLDLRPSEKSRPVSGRRTRERQIKHNRQ
jgi:hypothetical protein